MFSPPTQLGITRLRSFLALLEQIEPAYDPETLESIRNLLRNQIRVLETAEARVSGVADTPEK